jgi:hypothetical protein
VPRLDIKKLVGSESTARTKAEGIGGWLVPGFCLRIESLEMKLFLSKSSWEKRPYSPMPSQG